MRREESRVLKEESPRAEGGPWLETVASAVAVFLLGRWLRPEDPYFLGGPFSWPVLVVVLVGLQHGVARGLGAAVALGLGMTIAPGAPMGPGFPGETCLGLLSAAVIAGGFHGRWYRRLAHAEHQAGEARVRWERLSREWYLLRASHERLEERLVGGAPSLREVLSQLEAPGSGEEPPRVMGERLLGLVASHCGVQAAALYALEDGRWGAEPVAVLGACGVRSEDPLVRAALGSRRLASACSFSESGGDSKLLAAVPLVDGDGCVRGVLAISEMQFISFNDDTLRLLAALGRHVGELLARVRPEAHPGSVQRASRREELPVELVAVPLAERPRPMPEVP